MTVKRNDNTDNSLVREISNEKYKYGFTTDVHTEIIDRGLNEDVIRMISAKKGEPEWLLDFRLKAYNYWLTLEMPKWAHLDIPEIDFQDIIYYAAPKKDEDRPKEIDPELEKTFDKLGIPLHERAALAGVAVCTAVEKLCGFSIRVPLMTVPFCSMSSRLTRSQLCMC